MLALNSDGMCISNRIVRDRYLTIEGQPLDLIRGIVVHQTVAPNKESTLSHYEKRGSTGAHFLIDKDGTIIQTASLFKVTSHVGKMKSRCLVERRCTPADIKGYGAGRPSEIYRVERTKEVPDRYPANEDSLGIEIVGDALPRNVADSKKVFETVTDAQNASLGWLISMLTRTFGVPTREIYRHPDISEKNKTEASTARW